MYKNLKKMPTHIAFILDGNGRWAKERGLPRSMGHKAGLDNLKKILKECFYKCDIPYVSIYAFSTENWNRPQKEIDFITGLAKNFFVDRFLKNFPGVRLNIMGDYTKFPSNVVKMAEDTINATKKNTKYVLNLGVNYSGQDEIVHAINGIIADGIQSVDRDTVEKYLYTAGQPPVDLLVRSSGEQRLSNFMLWQLAYAEFYFSNVMWPAYDKKEFLKSLIDYQNRDRRFGGIKEQ